MSRSGFGSQNRPQNRLVDLEYFGQLRIMDVKPGGCQFIRELIVRGAHSRCDILVKESAKQTDPDWMLPAGRFFVRTLRHCIEHQLNVRHGACENSRMIQ